MHDTRPTVLNHDNLRRWTCLCAIAASCFVSASVRGEQTTFPPIRHAIKAVFGPNGNDHAGDLDNAGKVMAEGFDDLGIDLTRIEFKWAIIEPERGTYDWSEPDRLIDFLNANGIEPMLMLYCAPKWAMRGTEADEQLFIDRRQQNLHTVVWPRRDCMRDFERFCETAAKRYRGKARLFEFWNEPDGMAGPQVYHDINGKAVDVRFGGDAAEYTYWLKRMCEAVKRGNPDAVVAAGSLCVHDLRFVSAIYAAGGKDYCDAISLHPYANDGINVEWIKQVRGVMEQYGDYAKPIWLSEFGWHLENSYDDKAGDWKKGAYEQAEIIRKTATVIESLPYITQAYWFTLNDWNTSETGIDPTGTHRYGVMTLDLKRRPAFKAMKDVVAQQNDKPRAMPTPALQFQPPSNPINMGGQRIRATLRLSKHHPDKIAYENLDKKLTFSSDPPLDKMTKRRLVHIQDLDDDTYLAWLRWDMKPDAIVKPGLIDVQVQLKDQPATTFPVSVPATASRVSKSPTIDGQLDDWGNALGQIEDGQMRAGFAWDDTHLYFACTIKDELHEQTHHGRDIWKGDCVQLAFDPMRDAIRGSQYDINDSEFAMALTKDGPVMWRFIHPVGSYLGEAKAIKATVIREDSTTQYEAAIPWTELGVESPRMGRIVGVSIAGCDWDNGERTVYRFGNGIIAGKQPYRFASIRLMGPAQ